MAFDTTNSRAKRNASQMTKAVKKVTLAATRPSNKQKMKVAVLYSGGKDSTYAVQYCMEKGWEIAYLLSVKPTRTDCFLFHYATVEHTSKQAKSIGLKHKYVTCNIADPEREASIVKNIVAQNPVDAVVLGGTGLQQTQIGALQKAMIPLGIEVFASHAGMDHDTVMEEMIEKGYDIRIVQFASDGFGKEWLGKKIDAEGLKELKVRALQYGFHVGGEGGYFDTFVCDAPIFSKKIKFNGVRKVMENSYAGHLVVEDVLIQEKMQQPVSVMQK